MTDTDSQDPPDPLLDDPGILAAAAALDRQAAELEGAVPGAAPPAPTELIVIDWQDEARQFTVFAAEMFFPLYPRLETVWTPAKIASLDDRLAAVLKKYDLTLAKLLGKYGAEILLAAVIAPSILPTARAIRADNADLKAAAIAKGRAAPPAGQAAAAAPPAAPIRADPAAPGGPAAPPDPLALHKQV